MAQLLEDGQKRGSMDSQVEHVGAGRSYPKGILKQLEQVPLFLASVSVVAMTGLITLEVFLRSCIGISTLIADEVSGYLMVMVTFMGLTYTFESNRMIQLDFVYKHFSQRTKSTLDFVFHGVALLYSTILSYEFLALALKSKVGGVESIQTLRMPLFIPQMAMAIGTLFLALYFLSKLVTKIPTTRLKTSAKE